MRARIEAIERIARPAWGWDGFSRVSPLGWVALGLAAAHVALLVLLRSTHTTYWQPDELWTDSQVVATAVGFVGTAIGGAIVALVATIRFGEHSVLMLVPTLLGAFWAFWLLAQLPGWLG